MKITLKLWVFLRVFTVRDCSDITITNLHPSSYSFTNLTKTQTGCISPDVVSVSGKIVLINLRPHPVATHLQPSDTSQRTETNQDAAQATTVRCGVFITLGNCLRLSKHHCHTTFLREPNDSLEFHQVDRILLAVSFQKLVHQSKKFWNRLESGGADATACPKKSDQEKVKTTSKSKF